MDNVEERRVVTFADINDITNVAMPDVVKMCDLLVEAVRSDKNAPIGYGPSKGSRERSIVITKLQEARMWAEEATK